MTEPIVDYSKRAGANPMPEGWSPPHPLVDHTREMWEKFVAEVHDKMDLATPLTFWADISEFQPVVDSRYPYHALGVRLDNGNRLDNNARSNVGYVEKNQTHIEACIGYVVFIPGHSSSILSRIKNAFGSRAPIPICPEVDMESGSGFAGPGNHSGEANDLASELAVWAGASQRVEGYANGSDWSSNWPSHPEWMKRRLALYSSNATPAGFYSRQYYGALNYPVPRGYPTSCAPFGSWVDLNVTPRTLSQMLADYWLAPPPKPPAPPTPLEEDMPEIYVVDKTTVPSGQSWPGYVLWPPLVHIAAGSAHTNNLANFTKKYGAATPITYGQYQAMHTGISFAGELADDDPEQQDGTATDSPAVPADEPEATQ